jgi:hypothetical protein
VVNEDSDRTLFGKQMRSLIDGTVQAFLPLPD